MRAWKLLAGILVFTMIFAGMASAKQVKKLKIAMITNTTVEEPWNTAVIQAFDRIKAERPHGLDVEYKIHENVPMADGERVLRAYAQTGEYGIIWLQGQYPDAVENIHADYPEILWVVAGSSYKALGGNVYWIQMYVHEPAYLLGMLAGLMTENDTIGAVAAYPFPNVNLPINGYIDGAKSVNPDVKVKMTYIESWFDPSKAKESALAQISTGADFIYAERFGPFEACKDKGVYAFGHFVDQNDLEPSVVLGSTLALWDPSVLYCIDQWWNHQTKDTPYDAPMEEVVFSMAEGGSDISSFHELKDSIPADVLTQVEQARKDIKSGALKVPYNESQVKPD